MKLGKGASESSGTDVPKRIRNNIFDFLRAMLVKVSVKDGKISN